MRLRPSDCRCELPRHTSDKCATPSLCRINRSTFLTTSSRSSPTESLHSPSRGSRAEVRNSFRYALSNWRSHSRGRPRKEPAAHDEASTSNCRPWLPSRPRHGDGCDCEPTTDLKGTSTSSSRRGVSWRSSPSQDCRCKAAVLQQRSLEDCTRLADRYDEIPVPD
jgi:hypothetical protein